MIGTNLDMTARKVREEALELAKFGMDRASDAFHLVSSDARFLIVNDGAVKLRGYSREELLRMTVHDVSADLPLTGDWQRFWARLKHLGELRMETSTRIKSGEVIPVEATVTHFAFGAEEYCFLVMRDLRDEMRRARLEEQLRQSQRMESLGTLASGIAHDFNNQLAVILANVESAAQRIGADAESHENLREIAGATRRASDLVRQILTFSRQEPMRRAVQPVQPVVSEVVKLLRATLPAGIEIANAAPSDDLLASIDASQIHRVLLNLGTNAWHAMDHPTGCIGFDVAPVVIDAASLPSVAVAPGRYVRIRVRDDGRGMDEAVVRRIFEPFFTTKGVGKGTGLGLAVVHGIIAEHGGAVTVESAVGRGSTFSLYLPASDESQAATEPAKEQVHTGSGRVLFVDDEEAIVRVVRRQLQRLGYHVTSFVNPQQALKAFREDPMAFDVVVSDLNMPEMGGIELAQAVAALRPTLPFVLTSGNRTVSDDRVSAANIRYELEKPYSAASLSEMLARALGEA